MHRSLFTNVCFLLVILCLCASCNMPDQKTEVPAASDGGVAAWLDAPLDGSILPLAPFNIVAHGSDPQGVAQLELSINGEVIGSAGNSNPADLLFKSEYLWTPSGAGEYTIQARTRSTAGGWSEPAVAVVTVVEPTITPTVTVTITPTLTPTVTPTITPEFRGGTFTEPAFSPSMLAVLSRCGATDLYAEIGATDPDGIATVVMFYRIVRPDGTRTDWSNVSMNPSGNDLYTILVTPGSLMPSGAELGRVDPNAYTIEVQFVIQDNRGDLTRTEVYQAAQIKVCP